MYGGLLLEHLLLCRLTLTEESNNYFREAKSALQQLWKMSC